MHKKLHRFLLFQTGFSVFFKSFVFLLLRNPGNYRFYGLFLTLPFWKNPAKMKRFLLAEKSSGFYLFKSMC